MASTVYWLTQQAFQSALPLLPPFQRIGKLNSVSRFPSAKDGSQGSVKTPHKRLQERTVQLSPIKLQNHERYCSCFISQSFGVVGYLIEIGVYSIPGSILHHEWPQHPRTSVQNLHAPWVPLHNRHHWPALGLRNTHPCCPRGDKVGRNQLRSGK